MCISESLENYQCKFFPGTGSCHATISGKKKKKKCPHTDMSVESIMEKVKESLSGHKVCAGRPVNKSVIVNK